MTLFLASCAAMAVGGIVLVAVAVLIVRSGPR